jgi:hypothetical protein
MSEWRVQHAGDVVCISTQIRPGDREALRTVEAEYPAILGQQPHRGEIWGNNWEALQTGWFVMKRRYL